MVIIGEREQAPLENAVIHSLVVGLILYRSILQPMLCDGISLSG